jgi:ATP-dependent helicase/nuclease subunit A
MSTPSPAEKVKAEASREQHKASSPLVSAFVSANAGAGKTHVLVGRVIRLMLEEVEPERILCLTYTRAAAAEMSSRLFETLSKWIAKPDEELISEIHRTIGHVEFKREKLDLARRLFTRALETPGGLKVQTIHAFCERLLQRFPVEAGVMPGFSVLDETAERELLDEARARVLADGAPGLAACVETVVNHASEQTLVDLLAALVAQRGKLLPFASSNRFTELRARLNGKLGITDADDPDIIRSDFVRDADWRELGDVAEQLREFSNKTNEAQAAAIDAARQAPTAKEKFSLAAAFLLTAKGERKAETSLLTAKCTAKYPDALELLQDTQADFVAANNRIKALSVRDATEAIVAVALAVIGEYEILKQQASAYDYADLIGRTNELLNKGEAAAWVLYKLDRGLDHILIDEAQDTSPEQWDIVDAIAEEFFSGEGARSGVGRTMFAVGDRKQSIYSFQGAEPEKFEERLQSYRRKVEEAEAEFEDVGLLTSFRSSTAVLQAVDMVFSYPDVAKGVVPQGGTPVEHKPSRLEAEGLVEVWEIERQPKSGSPNPWNVDDEHEAETVAGPANVRLAHRIAQTIKRWLDKDRPEMLAPGVPVSPEHILILVRERASLMEAIVRELKDAQVPVAGADRLRLLEHITAQDLMALGHFSILPEDDLTLASLLKSPLLARDDGERFNDDDDIFPLAHQRGMSTLWQRLHDAVAAGKPYAQALARLEAWRAEAGRTGVYRFYSGVLSRDRGRAAFLKAIGHEAGEPVDAFLQQCLDYEREGLSTMAGFLAWLEATATSLKRDMEQGSGEVRVMTVHGAKGLEAPIVFLPDTCSKPDGKKVGSILFDASDDDPPPVWRLKKDFEVEYTKDLKDAAQEMLMEEYNRLLYVAMTRARDRLYVCGFKKSRKTDGWETDEPDEGTWYHSIRRALVDSGIEATGDAGSRIWRLGSGRIGDMERKGITLADAPVELPDWAMRPAPPVARPERWLAPSKLAEIAETDDGWSGEVALSPLAPREDRKFRRGELVHRLLQSLPDLPMEKREAAARRYLARNGVEGTALEETVGEIMQLFADARFADVFSPHAQAEVSVAGLVEPPEAERFGLSGQIDRLLVTDSRVLVVDFKTNRPPPSSLDAVPEGYLRQLAAYAHLLSRLYPGRQVECALLWTDAPSLMAVPQDMLDRAWRAALFKSA